jgi:hypothetical protein
LYRTDKTKRFHSTRPAISSFFLAKKNMKSHLHFFVLMLLVFFVIPGGGRYQEWHSFWIVRK